MRAGRDLDALVAEKIFGAKVTDWPTGQEFSLTSAVAAMALSEAQQSRIPKFSTDISAAWEVVEKLKDKYVFELSWEEGNWSSVGTDQGECWNCYLENEDLEICHIRAQSNLASHAICLAALKAIGVEV